MNSDSLLKRKALAMILPERRKAWAREHPLQADCSTCLKYRKVSRTCFYPSHFWGPRLEAAFRDLCGGKLPETVTETAKDNAGCGAHGYDARGYDMNGTATAEDPPAETETAAESTETETETDADAAFGKDRTVDLAEALRAAMRANAPQLDVNAVKAIVRDMIKDIQPGVARMEVTTITDGERKTTDVGLTHEQFPKLLQRINAKVNTWIAGPTGSGKTHAVEQAARALGLPFYFNGAIDTEYKLSGFVDAAGRIVSTPFRTAFTQGGVYLFDEVDASMPAAVLAFNAALSNGACDFPGEDKPITRHPDFRCVAGANTWGNGATMEYVGRAKMDAAFLDRFVFLRWDYDEKLERSLSPDPDWCVFVQKLRAVAKSRGLKVILSPRTSITGGMLLKAGADRKDVIAELITNKMTPESAIALGL